MNGAFSSLRLALAMAVGSCLGVAGRGAEAEAPVVSFSIRGVADGMVEQGEPLGVAVRLAVPPRSAATFELAPSSGAWIDAVSVELVKAGDGEIVARAGPVGQPDARRVTLDPQRAVGGIWLFAGTAMHALAPGNYAVRVKLLVETGAGWRGRTSSASQPLKVVVPSTVPARVVQRTLALAYEALAGQRPEQAAAMLDAQLTLSPDQRSLWLLRAVVAEQAGNLSAALLCVNRAAAGLSAKGPPPAELHVVRARLQAKMLQPPAAGEAADPPAWSWPPARLVASSQGNGADLSTKSQSAPAASTTPGARVVVPAAAAVSPVAVPSVAPKPTPPATTATSTRAQPPSIITKSVADTRPLGAVVPANELSDSRIRADAAGQWAATAEAKSSYGKLNYGPGKATGAPDVGVAGDSVDAWCPGQQSGGTDWLEVAFAKPTRAVEVRVRQNHSPGAIARVEAIEADGTAHLWWEGKDPYVVPAIRDIAWFAVRVPATSYAVAKIKLTLDLAVVPGWKQIDAVQLVAAP